MGENSRRKVQNVVTHSTVATFTEDASRIRKETGPGIFSVFRRLALNILQRGTIVKSSIGSKRKICGLDEDKFEKRIADFFGN